MAKVNEMANQLKKLRYLSHGKPLTGGYFHEVLFAKSLANYLQFDLEIQRFENDFEGLSGYLKLLWKGFCAAKADLVISVARLSIPVLIKNIFSTTKIILVWHYHDENANISRLLKVWYRLSLSLMRLYPSSRLKVVVVAPFWQSYFEKVIGKQKIHFYPNLFDHSFYKAYRTVAKKKQVHLGQVSFKNHPDIFWIAAQITQLGYASYLSTNDKTKLTTQESIGLSVKYFESHEGYLKEMAASLYTLALPNFNEGWNRVAHESIMVGTPVIGYPMGGLADLLELSKSEVALNKEEVLEMIRNKRTKAMSIDLKSYDVSENEKYLEDLKKWIIMTKK